MDNKVEVVDIQKIKEILSSTPYHKLQKVLAENGIDSVWKQGKKKDVIINEALALYEKTREEIRAESKVEVPEEPVKAEEAILPSTDVDNPQKIIPQYAKSGLIDPSLTKEVLEYNLKNIKANLKNNLPAHRAILLAKQQEIEDLLKKM